MSVDRQEPEMQLIWAPTIIISPTQPVAIGQPRQLQVSLKLTVCFAFSGFLRILIGILHQKNFYCLNLIFWILFMGCGKARFGQRGLKTTFTWTFGIKICRQGFEGRRHRPQGAVHLGVPRGPRWSPKKPLATNFETKMFQFTWFLCPSDQNKLYHTTGWHLLFQPASRPGRK